MSRPHASTQAVASTRTARAVGAAVLLVSIVGGCARKQPVARGVPALDINGSPAFGTFVKQNEAVLKPNRPVSAVYSLGDSIFLYTGENKVYSLSSGLDIRYIAQVAGETERVRPPVIVNNETIFPTSTGLEVFNELGAPVRSVALRDPLTSNVNTDGRGALIAGTAAPTGGMVSVIDPKLLVRPQIHKVLIGNVLSAPVAMQGTIFAANERGYVYAIDPTMKSVWGLPDMHFTADNQITADLVADDYAVYVASTDTKLYALDRGTGHIRWRFQAEVPLRESPLLTADRVYQIVPGRGLAALSKTDEREYHDPIWMASGVTKVLSADDRYVYAVQGRDRLVALGLADGKPKFSVAGKFDYFVAGPDNTIVAVTNAGAVATFKRGTYTGENVASR